MMVSEASAGERDDRDAQALYDDGVAYLEGDGKPQDLRKATECLQAAAKRGIADAYNYLGFIYGAEMGGAANEARAFRCYCKGGEAGNVQAMMNAASCLADGAGVKPDTRKALYWYEKAAQTGSAEAAFEAGNIYDLGEGVEEDMDKAMEWYLCGAERGCEEAMYRVGHLLYFGCEGIETDPRAGFDWLRKAVENDAGPYAVLDLGICYWERDDEDSHSMSIRLFEQALSADVPEAHKYLGISFLLGRGVDRDADRGLEHLKQGAKERDVAAAFSLAECYTDGIGVEPSRYWAEHWYKKAVAALPREDRARFRRNNPFPLRPPSERDSVLDSIRRD